MSKFDSVIKEKVKGYGSEKTDREPLRSCPFCGSTDIGVDEHDETMRQCRCQGCGACGPKGNLKQAIDGWNKRVPE